MDRKSFFKMALKLGAKKGYGFFTDNSLVKALEKLTDDIKQRPPGSHPREFEFKRLCTGCDACMIACPVNVIMIDDMERRYPVIYPHKDPCIKCQDVPCIASCPTGALKLEYSREPREF